VPDLTNVDSQQQQTSNIIFANTHIYSTKRTQSIFQNRFNTCGSGATTSIAAAATTTTTTYRHNRFAIQSVQTTSRRRSAAGFVIGPQSQSCW
jgi:hypothetical protein